MPDIRDTKLRRLDLTTLLVFDQLMRLRKASAAADSLGLTPPGVSHALKRLREVFGDELFIRRPHGLEPTAFACALEPRVSQAIEALREGLSDLAAFDPSSATGTLRIGALDYELATLMPRLIKTLAAKAPGMRAVARAVGRGEALNGLSTGDLDAALGFFPKAPDTVQLTKLYTETYVVVARRRSTARRALTLNQYCAAQHVLVSPGGDLVGIVDSALARMGRKRAVIAAVPLFLPALAVVRESGVLATVPKRLADRFAGVFGLEIISLPLSVRPFDVALARHRRNARSAMHDWLERVILEVAQKPARARP